MSDLKPCPNPWCDGPAVLHDDLLRVDDTGTGYDAAVSCLHCDNSTPYYRSPAEAIAAWNTRADTAKPVASDLIERWGFKWKGHDHGTHERMADGYWTPWHIAAEALTAKDARIDHLEQMVAQSGEYAPLTNSALRADIARLREAGRVLAEAAASAIYGLPEMLEQNALSDDEGMVAEIELALATFRQALGASHDA